MSISLNNHEIRIKNLENRMPSDGKKITKIWSGSQSWGNSFSIGNVSQYDIVVIRTACGPWEEYIPIPVTGETVRFSFGDNLGRTVHNFNTSNGSISYTGTYSGGNHDDNYIVGAYGLKIYYIFRYNIYNKIIRSIISRLSHIFTSPILVNGGEIYDN